MSVAVWAYAYRLRQIIERIHEFHSSPALDRLYLSSQEVEQLSKLYGDTSNSIYWNKARASAKRQVNRELDRIAWGVAIRLDSFPILFNRWCDEQQQLNRPFLSEAFSIKNYLSLTQKDVERYWGHRVRFRQLELFDT